MKREAEVLFDDFDIDPAKLDPLKASRNYYERGRKALQASSWLDGLVDLRLAEEHLIGRYAPRHKPLDPEKVPLKRTIPLVISLQREARKKLREEGPGEKFIG